MFCDECGKKRKLQSVAGVMMCRPCIEVHAAAEADVVASWPENKGKTKKRIKAEIIAAMLELDQ